MLNYVVPLWLAGDGRVNEQVGLSAIHHVWHRAHNSIEEILHDINPHWDVETLFEVLCMVSGPNDPNSTN